MSQIREVYGITGLKGHGKDYFAKLVRGYNSDFAVDHFARHLKELSSRIFGLSVEQVNDTILKESPLPNGSIHLDEYLSPMRSLTELDIKPCGKVAATPREVLQFFGTEYVRHADHGYWVDVLIKNISDLSRVLVPDLRFLNERAALLGIHGKVIQILRLDMKNSKTDSHRSESEMAQLKPDLLLGTFTDDASIPRRVASLIAMGDFEAAQMYDLRSATLAIQAVDQGERPWVASSKLDGNGDKVCAMFGVLEYYHSSEFRKEKLNDFALKT